MEYEDFKALIQLEFDKMMKIMELKNQEYARGGDKLSNFKTAADFRRREPESMCFEYCTKHLVSLSDLINDLENDIHRPLPLWAEKITDAVNYLFLLKALLQERYNGAD